MAGRIFISYASNDIEMANSVCQFLEARGIGCWIAPRDMPVTHWAEALVNAIDDSLAVIFLLSEPSSQSGPVMNEIVQAGSKNKPIFTLKLGPVTSTSRFDFFIAPWQWLDLTTISLEEALPKLADSLCTLVVTPEPGVHHAYHIDPVERDDLSQRPTSVMVLEASRHGHEDILRLSAYERAPNEVPAVRPSGDVLAVSFTAVQQEIDNLLTLLDRATNSAGVLDAVSWHEIRAQGEKLYTQLLTPAIRETLKTSKADDLLLCLDDTLVHIPWELLFDGDYFLCRRFSIGRSVSTAQPLAKGPPRQPQHPLKMLMVADPQDNLPAALKEGKTLQGELTTEGHHFQVDLRCSSVSITAVTSALAQCDVLHYAGHAAYAADRVDQSSWLLADGKLTAAQVGQLGEYISMPALVFCNACQSGQTTPWQIDQSVGHAIYGLANAFLVSGTQHYIGTLWNIPDEPSALFAIEFYRALVRGATVGMALRHARQRLITRYPTDSVVWASYVLYGDPTSHYLEAASELSSMDVHSVLVASGVTPPETTSHIAPEQPRAKAQSVPEVLVHTAHETTRPHHSKRSILISAAAIVCLVVGLGAWWGNRLPPQEDSQPLTPLTVAYQTLDRGDHQKAHEIFQTLAAQANPQVKSQGLVGLAAVAWARGDAQQTAALARQAEAVDPEVVYSHVLHGDVLWQQGKTAEATAVYRTAITKKHGIPWQHAVAYNRLGRLYAVQGETQQALEQYDKALSQAANGHQEKALAYTNKGHVLATLGRYQEALRHYRQALQLNSGDRLTRVLLDDAERRERLAQDQAQQERLDKLVADLLQMHREGKVPSAIDDDWSSRPLVMGFPPLQSQGTPSLRAGEDDMLLSRLGEAFQAQHMKIVERATLDKLLAELKLSASELVQHDEAARVGHILAARLMALGSLTRNGAEIRLSVRVVDTETTAIQAMASAPLQPPLDREGIADQLVSTLIQKLRAASPLQGRIVETTDDEVVLNIGSDHGVTPGLTLQVFGDDEPPGAAGKITRRRQVGVIEVTNAEEARFSRAKVLQQTGAFIPGWKVREK